MKYLFSIIFYFLVIHSIFPQSKGLRIGGHFGIGQATIEKAGIVNQTGKLALQAGLAMNYQFGKNIGINSNILFTGKGSRSSGTETISGFFGSTDYKYEENYSLYYIEIPVMPKLSLGINNFHIKGFAGPSINFNIYGKQDKIYEDQNYNENNGYVNKEITGLNLLEYSFLFGGGFDVETSDASVFYLDFRKSMSLNSFGSINNKNAFNDYFSVGIGYLYKY